VAKVLDQAARHSVDGQRVREYFFDRPSFLGKKTISVNLEVFTIDEVVQNDVANYFFDAVAAAIQYQIKVPKYASRMQNDFSTSTSTHVIASQINLMASVQYHFAYEMHLVGCGIKGVEMLGTQEDWDKLVIKWQDLRTQLQPLLESSDRLRGEIGEDWFHHVEHVFGMLAKTYGSSSSTTTTTSVSSKDEIHDFWADILAVSENGWKRGPSAVKLATKHYNGWLIKLLTGQEKIVKERFFPIDITELLKGTNSVRLQLSLPWTTPPVTDNRAELVAGIMGFELQQNTFNGVPSVQPHHMWALKLARDSKCRLGR
jgi:hypothetical protein